MKFPAYGKALWNRRLMGETPRVVVLLVGDKWKAPRWVPRELPRLAVRSDLWHVDAAERFDWRLVAGCTVLAVDVRQLIEIDTGPDEWDSWLWLLADVQRYAREVLMFSPSIDDRVVDPPNGFAAERCLEVHAWLHRSRGTWPVWWPHGNAIFERFEQRRMAA